MWLTTKDGRHFNTDWIDKEKQIAENKRQSDELNGKSPSLTTQEEIDDMMMELNDEDFKKQMNIRGDRYFGNDYGRDLNRFLSDEERMQYLYERPDYQSSIKILDNSMVAIPRDVVVERYVDKHNLPGFDMKNPQNLVGKTIHTPGYLSTTIDAQNSKFEFSNYGARIIIKAPKGTKAILGANHKEAEILFHRNSDYKITSFKMGTNSVGDKQIIYYAELKKE